MSALWDDGVSASAPASSGAAEARSASRLEQETHYDKGEENKEGIVFLEPLEGAQWVINIDDFGDGAVEVVAYQVDEKPKKPKKGSKGEGSREQMSLEDLERASIRAKRTMRHKVMMMKADRMLTLTTRDCIEDRAEFLGALNRFTRACKKQFGGFTYVSVLELQERGAYHAHLALNRFYNVKVLRHIWKKAVGGDANVDITTPRKGFWNRHKIASYLSKYMAKDQEGQQMNTKRFMSSSNIQPPRRIKFYMPITWNIFYLLKKVSETITKVKMVRFWESKDGGIPIIWFASYT